MTTRQSLLQEAKQNANSEAWLQLHGIYEPLIVGWVFRAGIDESDVSDVTQEVLTALCQELASFEHNGRIGAFRNWLKMITVHRCRRYWSNQKKKGVTALANHTGLRVLDDLEDPKSDFSTLWKNEHDRYVFENVLKLIQTEFEPQVYDVFVRNTLNDESPAVIAKSLGLTISRVYKIKFRVMQRLKHVANGLLDGDA